MTKLLADITIAAEFGKPTEIVEGLFLLRLPLASKLDHVNAYLIKDGEGYAVFDTGIGDERTRAIWTAVLADFFRDQPITKLIISHYHADHIGLAGWLSRQFDLHAFMSRQEHAMSTYLLAANQDRVDAGWNAYYRDAGFDAAEAANLATRRWHYHEETSGLPARLWHLSNGDELSIGSRHWRIITGNGHTVEQMMLLCEADNILIAADHLLPIISPNVGFYAHHKDRDDPLGDYLSSLQTLYNEISAGALILPGHKLPFHGAQSRIKELQTHHAERCALILDACSQYALSCKDLYKILFNRPLEFNQLIFAIGETLAHITYLRRKDQLVAIHSHDGILYRTIPVL